MAKKGFEDRGQGLGRREVLECMVWAGTGVLWAVSGGVPHSVGLIGDAVAAESTAFTFLQMSDSHIGFDKAANPDALGTLREAVAKVKAMPIKPSFIIHTGDITHLSKPAEFDNAEKVFGETGVQIHYVPGEHDIIDEERGKAYLERYGKGSKGAGWYSYDDHGIHFMGLLNVAVVKGGGLGICGAETRARHPLQPLRQRRRSEGRRFRQPRRRATGMARGRPEGQVEQHADRRVCAYPAAGDLQGMGLGYRGWYAGARSAQALRFSHRSERAHSSAGPEGRGQHDLPHRLIDGFSSAGSR